MSLQMAKQRRLEALKNRSGNRLLVKPAKHMAQVNLPAEGTVADYLINALIHGTTTEQLARETGWTKQTVTVNLYKVAKKSGVGISRCGETMKLEMPTGAKSLYPRAKVVASESTVRSMAADVVVAEDDRPVTPRLVTSFGDKVTG